MLLGEKVKLGEDQVTVLPEVYRRQQTQLAIVLGKIVLPELVGYKSIFYSLEPSGTVLHEEVHV
jgi:hypothetical protein